ncbi:hypothetical protein NHX12_022630 [Muraenolepis orangiensis]|uniref:Cilia- and flagella-associated protein 46 n=1 Tax=Muraenolepis orangiensis TaxID=630683 RepID=A0A9Q0EQJ7_9TELE|nr:hypothetical protein NHX12_022630 [Muraenolepis orangiensis]
MGCLEISAACLKLFFDGNPATDQLLCRAYLCQGQLNSPATTGNVEDFESALLYFQKAVEMSKSNPRYHFLAFNASLRYLQAVRPLLRPGLRRRLAPSLALVVSALEEVEEPDRDWRAELMIHLVECLVDDPGRREEARRYSNVTSEFVKSHAPRLYPKFLTIMARHKLLEPDGSPDVTKQCPSLAVLHKIQNLQRAEGGEETACHLGEEDVAGLREVFNLLVERTAGPGAVTEGQAPTRSPRQTSAPIPPAERVVLLLELAALALRWKQQEVGAGCLKELNSAEGTTASQRIMVECVRCELNVLRKQGKNNVYSKAGIEARLKEIGRLDGLLRRTASEGDPGAMQAVCATQWTVCLPLLQRNLRRRITPELQRVAQVLEDMQSPLLEMRCQVHSELASVEEEEGRLEASLGHLKRAMPLADGPQRQRLAAAVQRLHLRGTLYSTPCRPEDRAAMLLQQAKDKPPQDVTDIRPTLVQAGLLLAPDAFRTVLDADGAPESSDESEPAARLSAKAQHHSRCVQGVQGHLERQADDSNAAERVHVWAALVKAARAQEVWDVCRAACRFCLLYDDSRWIENGESSKVEQSSPRSGSFAVPSKDTLRLLAEVCFIDAEATIQKLRDWIQSLSAYATAGFLRGAELGAELGELWMVDNAAVYLWNYSRPLLVIGEYRTILPIFQTLVDTLRRTGYCGDHAGLLLLCDCVSRGLVQPLLGQEGVRAAAQQQPESDKTKKGAGKTAADNNAGPSTHVGVGALTLEPAALQDLHKALELCEFALRLSSGAVPGDNSVSMATRKQVLATWVQIKRLLQQPVGQTADIIVEGDESVAAMTRVLVAMETHLCCDREGVQAEPAVPGLLSLVGAASDCVWSDAAVELQVWSQLASLCHRGGNDHDLVLRCTRAALLLEGAASRSISGAMCPLYGPHAVNEMLSSVACLRGLSLAHKSNGDLRNSEEALQVLLSGVSYAEKAQSPALCRAAARHYWNTCLPLTRPLADRQQLQGPLERILRALGDWERALQVLDKAVGELPRTRHRLLLLRQRTLVCARLGRSVLEDMAVFQGEGEHVCSAAWHQVALCSPNPRQQLACFQKALAALSEQGAEGRWQKADLLLEFGEWLYSHNQPLQKAQHHLQWAIDLLLRVDPEQAEDTEDLSKERGPSDPSLQTGVQAVSGLSELWEVRRLDGLIRAHILLGFMEPRSSPGHQENLLRACVFVLRTWTVSMATQLPIIEEKPKGLFQEEDLTLPSTPEGWGRYVCPDAARDTFRTGGGHPRCISKCSITKQAQSLFYLDLLVKELHSLSLPHLSLPVLHLAETIAHDLLDRKGLSDLYRLRIVRTCCELGMEAHSPYRDKLLDLSSMREQDLIECQGKDVFIAWQRRSQNMQPLKSSSSEPKPEVRVSRRRAELSCEDVWLDKAEVCLSMGIYPPARQLLGEAHLLAKEVGNHEAEARALMGLAVLACEEGNHGQALEILDQTEDLAGDEEFWYQLILTRVRATASLGDQEAGAKVDVIIQQGCEALRSLLGQRPNRAPRLRFWIASLEMRGAAECIHSMSGRGPGKSLSDVETLRLTYACDALKEAARELTELGHEEQAAQAHLELAMGLRVLAMHAGGGDGEKRHLLDSVRMLQEAVSMQEHAVLRAQSLAPSQESPGLTWPSARRLRRLRLSLAERCLTTLEQLHAEEEGRARVHRAKTATQRELEVFTLDTPEPSSLDQEWAGLEPTLVQVALGTLAAVESQCAGWQHAGSQQLRSQAIQVLGRAVGLCLQRGLPSAVLADASLQMLECHGRLDPAASGQYLALYQSCRSSAAMAQVLGSACSRAPGASHLSSLLGLHANLLRSHDEIPSSRLRAVEDHLSALPQAYRHLAIDPDHLSILGDLPPNLTLLLLQHNHDGSKLYGALYEKGQPTDQHKGKAAQSTAVLTCSRVAKASVSPGMLLALRGHVGAFARQTGQTLLDEACRHGNEAGLSPQSSGDEQAAQFRAVVEEMENYLHPVISQFDFSRFSNPRKRSPPLSAQGSGRLRDKEDKRSGSAIDQPGECVVVLADPWLQDLPLEALSVLQGPGVGSVSRDFSLQLLHTRHQHQKEGASLAEKMRGILDHHSQLGASLCDGLVGSSKHTPSLTQVEQLLGSCSGFVYLGTERFMANVAPVKLAALDLSECRLALLFDLLQSGASAARQSELDRHKRSPGGRAPLWPGDPWPEEWGQPLSGF